MDQSNKADNANNQNDLTYRWSIGHYVLVSLLILMAVIVVLIVASRWLNTSISDRVQFVTANLLNALIFAAIVAQVVIYRNQRDIMQRQADSFDIVERAYVGIKEMLVEQMEVGKPLIVMIVFQNGGRTPAWDVKCTANLILYPPRRYKPSELSLKGAFFLPAGFDKQRPVVFDFSPTAEDLEKILAGEIQIIVYGKLE
ncbi:MAG TPA: hypothetical protein VKB02_00435 [Pyrinomonadaceae bacterium]|nr:hypothetical protein [Pyrinomonadaceae bacterium]